MFLYFLHYSHDISYTGCGCVYAKYDNYSDDLFNMWIFVAYSFDYKPLKTSRPLFELFLFIIIAK
jgi:hypothetical protein